jgi:YVTN family beta-propeller protein
LPPGTSVKLAVLHKGAEKTITLTLGQLPNEKEARADTGSKNDAAGTEVPRLGLTLAPAGQVAGSGNEGVVVTNVDPSGVAAGTDVVWVSNERAGTLSRIDPATDHVVQTVPTGNRPKGVAVAGNAIVLKPLVTSPKIEVGEFSYYNDADDPTLFETRNVQYTAGPEKLMIGKFCAIATGAEFLLSSANHPMNRVGALRRAPDAAGQLADRRLHRHQGCVAVGAVGRQPEPRATHTAGSAHVLRSRGLAELSGGGPNCHSAMRPVRITSVRADPVDDSRSPPSSPDPGAHADAHQAAAVAGARLTLRLRRGQVACGRPVGRASSVGCRCGCPSRGGDKWSGRGG